MTVAQLIDALAKMPPTAVVLYESDEGYALIGDLSLQENGNGIPDEVILQPDMNE
jgi:hypothetical protein